MADIVRVALHNGRVRWLESLYALLLLSAIALVTLLLGEIYYAVEEQREAGVRNHGVVGPIFDLAWFVFVPTLLASLVGSIVALIAGRILHRSRLSRYGTRAIAFCSLAVAVVAAVAIAQL